MYALILSGGRGERLRPLTDSLPKPMIPVEGKPVIWHQIQWLKAGGISDVVFLAGYRWEAIQEYFGDGSSFGVRVHYSIEDSPLGRGGAIRQGMSSVPEDESSLVVTNGDIITAEPLKILIDTFDTKIKSNPSHLATIMVVPFVSPYGLVDLSQGNDVEGFREKVQLPYWINGGIYVFARSIEERLPTLGDHETTTFPELAQESRLSALRSRAFWRSVDSFKDLRETEDHLKGS